MQIKFLLLLFIFLNSTYLTFANDKRITKIVLDAGHGGNDIGARGKISVEKDLTLAIVKKLGKILHDSMRTVEVLYTRTTDIYPTLQERHEIANKAGADVFISIHINSTAPRKERIRTGTRTVKRKGKTYKQPVYKVVYHRETEANGTETYVLGLKRNNQKEDAIGEYSENIVEEPGLLNENDPMTAIIISQYSQAFLSRSVTLGTKIQDEFSKQGREDKGVKQMSLEVLAGSAMPGVLVECGFINNPDEEVMMNSEEGQYKIAMAIYKGIKEYKKDVEKN